MPNGTKPANQGEQRSNGNDDILHDPRNNDGQGIRKKKNRKKTKTSKGRFQHKEMSGHQHKKKKTQK